MAALPVPVEVQTSTPVGIITSTKPPQVQPNPTILSIGHKQNAEWHCDDPKRRLVVRFPEKGEKPDYNGSPFGASEFPMPPGTKVCSGPPLESAVCGLCSRPPDTSVKKHLHYKYSVYAVTPGRKETFLVDATIIIIRP